MSVERSYSKGSENRRAARILKSTADMRVRYLEELSQFFHQECPQEWEDARLYISYVRREFPRSALAVDAVSILTVLKLYAMSQEDRNELFDHLPDYVRGNLPRWNLFEQVFATLRELPKAEGVAKKPRRVA